MLDKENFQISIDELRSIDRIVWNATDNVHKGALFENEYH